MQWRRKWEGKISTRMCVCSIDLKKKRVKEEVIVLHLHKFVVARELASISR